MTTALTANVMVEVLRVVNPPVVTPSGSALTANVMVEVLRVVNPPVVTPSGSAGAQFLSF